MGIDAEMRVRIPEPLDDRELMALSVAAVDAFREFFWVDRERRQAAIERWEAREWDEVPEGEGHWLKVNTMSRFYGEGYQRGPIVTILAVAEWFELRILGCEVFYGGDHDDYVEPLTAERRGELFRHFAQNGHRPYRDNRLDRGEVPECDWCGPSMRATTYHALLATTYECIHCGYSVKVEHPKEQVRA